MSRLADQIKEALAAFADLDVPPALIGGLALSAHRVIRATQDVDFIAAAEDAERIHAHLGTSQDRRERAEDKAPRAQEPQCTLGT